MTKKPTQTQKTNKNQTKKPLNLFLCLFFCIQYVIYFLNCSSMLRTHGPCIFSTIDIASHFLSYFGDICFSSLYNNPIIT